MTFKYHILQPFDLENSLKSHGWFQLVPFYWNESLKLFSWVTLLDSPVKIDIRQRSRDESKTVLEFTVERTISADEKNCIIQKFEHIFSLHLDLSTFYSQCESHNVLKYVRKLGLGHLMRSESLYEDIIKSICGTNVQWTQAVKMVNNIAAAGPIIENLYHAFPSPGTLLEKGESYFKETGRVGYRSRYLLDCCNRFVNGEVQSKQAEKGRLNSDELRSYFTSFSGIGPITANYLLALYGSFEDIAVDSFVLSYMKNMHFGYKPTPAEVQDYYAQFGSWRYLAYWMEMIINNGWSATDG